MSAKLDVVGRKNSMPSAILDVVAGIRCFGRFRSRWGKFDGVFPKLDVVGAKVDVVGETRGGWRIWHTLITLIVLFKDNVYYFKITALMWF